MQVKPIKFCIGKDGGGGIFKFPKTFEYTQPSYNLRVKYWFGRIKVTYQGSKL